MGVCGVCAACGDESAGANGVWHPGCGDPDARHGGVQHGAVAPQEGGGAVAPGAGGGGAGQAQPTHLVRARKLL